MTWLRKNWWWPLSLIVLVSLAGKREYENWTERKDAEAFVQRASAAVLAAAPDRRAARVVSIDADRGSVRACGWADLGPADGVVPFLVYDFPDAEGPHVRLPLLFRGDPATRVTGAFDRQLILEICDVDERRSAPPGALTLPGTDRQLAALWDTPGERWAVVQVPGDAGYMAVARRTGGGPILSPVKATYREAWEWTRGEGVAIAARANAEGEAWMKAYKTCLDRHKPGDPARERC